jgi:hypothetical protein
MIQYLDSHSDMMQESFVISIMKEKQNGYYVEVGSGLPIKGNNTYMLENTFNWKGVGIDLNIQTVDLYNETRNNPCIHADALIFNYEDYFKKNNFPNQIDFLQIDIDSSTFLKSGNYGNQNLLALINLPLNRYRFSVIIFEHEYLVDYKNNSIKKAQREILSNLNYKLVGQNALEDWWVDPTVIEKETYYNESFVGWNPNVSKIVEKGYTK